MKDEDIPAKRYITQIDRERLQRRKKQKSKEEENYLAGRFEWEWIDKADKANALKVALYLFQLSTMRKSNHVQLGATKTAEMLGMNSKTLYRKLEALKEAGLIEVERRKKVWPKIRLLGQFRATPTERSKR